MKRVIYVRHAKSSWKEAHLSDKLRPLNKRGKCDAPVMTQKITDILSGLNIEIDSILCSSSRRTTDTCAFLIQSPRVSSDNVVFDDKLYHADEDYLIETLFQLSDEVENVIVCAHNPGLTYLANSCGLTTDNVPTTGMFEVKFNCDSWLEVSTNDAETGFFIYPKMFKNE